MVATKMWLDPIAEIEQMQDRLCELDDHDVDLARWLFNLEKRVKSLEDEMERRTGDGK